MPVLASSERDRGHAGTMRLVAAYRKRETQRNPLPRNPERGMSAHQIAKRSIKRALWLGPKEWEVSNSRCRASYQGRSRRFPSTYDGVSPFSPVGFGEFPPIRRSWVALGRTGSQKASPLTERDRILLTKRDPPPGASLFQGGPLPTGL